jgi:tetratricopeptide (TPR) repeat protein
MHSTLNLVEHLLAMGRTYQQLGRTRDALSVLRRLTGFRELPADAAEEAQARLGELQLKRRQYRRARRHLTAALRHQPRNARYHYLLATAVQAEDRGDLERAAEHYRRSLEIDPNDVQCLTATGLLAVRLGRVEDGLAQLRRAVELAPDDPEVLRKLVKGLRLAGRGDEARTALRAALFQNPRQPRFRKLWNEFQFQLLRQRQQTERQHDDTGRPFADEPVLLPFLRVAHEARTREAHPVILRHDETAAVPGSQRSQREPWPDTRHVQ